MTHGSIEVTPTVRAGLADVAPAVRAAPVALALLFVSLTALQTATLFGAPLLWSLLLVVLEFLAAVLAYGALFRRTFALGPGGVQWDRLEWRLTGSSLLAAFFYFLTSLFALVMVVIVVAGVTFATGGIGAHPDPAAATPAVWAAAVVVTLYLLAVIWSGVRLSLFLPATVAAGQIQVFSTWTLTRERFWPLLATLVLSSLPSLLTGLVVALIVAALRRGGTPVDWPLALVFGALVGGVGAFVQAPLIAAVLTRLYRACATAPAESPEAGAPLRPVAA